MLETRLFSAVLLSGLFLSSLPTGLLLLTAPLLAGLFLRSLPLGGPFLRSLLLRVFLQAGPARLLSWLFLAPPPGLLFQSAYSRFSLARVQLFLPSRSFLLPVLPRLFLLSVLLFLPSWLIGLLLRPLLP